MTDEQISKLSPYHRDFLEVWGNQWAPKKVMPGTCEACVWGRGEHAADCVTVDHWREENFRHAPYVLYDPTVLDPCTMARDAFLDAAFDLNQRGIL